MEPKTVDAGRSRAWLSCGWRIFMRSPLWWIALGIAFLAILFVLSQIPFLGVAAASLLAPVLSAGLLCAAREADAGRALAFTHLFQGFTEPGRLRPLLALGGVALAGAVVSGLLTFLIVGPEVLRKMMAVEGMAHGALPEGMALAASVVLAVELPVATALFYAVPLVMFGGFAPGAALRSSMAVSLRNFLPLLVFSALYAVLAVLATIPLLLGWIVLLPVSVGMLYCSFKDLYE